MKNRLPFYLVLGVLLGIVIAPLLLAQPSMQGQFPLRWDPVQGADHYRVAWGASSGNYTGSYDTPDNSTSVVIPGFEDCIIKYLAVKAVDAQGAESASWSSELIGLPSMRLDTSGAGSSIEQGQTYTFLVTGANFEAGTTLSVEGEPGLAFAMDPVTSCTGMSAQLTVAPTVAPGSYTLLASRPDGAKARRTDGVVVIRHVLPADVQNVRRGDTQ